MTAERRQQVERIYQETAARTPSQRVAFLEQACAGDPDLRGEVERMLSCEAGLRAFLEAPAADLAARDLARKRLSAGTRIARTKSSHYSAPGFGRSLQSPRHALESRGCR